MALQFLLTSDVLQSLRLTTSPVGWNELKYLFARDEKYHGVNLTMSSGLTFWKQGAAYLRALYEGAVDSTGAVTILPGGVDANAVLNVYDTDPNEFRTRVIYRGRVDFTTYRSSEAGVSVNLKELGFATNLLSRADAAVELLGADSLGGAYLAPLSPTSIRLHSQMLRLKYAATQVAEVELSPGAMFGDEDDESHEQLLYFGFDTPGENDLGLQAVAGGFVAGDRDTVIPILPITFNGKVTVEFDLRAAIAATNNGQGPEFETVEGDGYFKVVHADGTIDAYRLFPDFYAPNLGGDYYSTIKTGPQSYTIDCRVGDAIYLYARYFVHKIGGLGTSIRYRSTITATMLPGSYLRITAESTTPEGYCRGLLTHEVLQRLTEAMTDQPGGFYSEYYGRPDSMPAYAMDGPGALRLVATGFAVRDFPFLSDSASFIHADGTDPRKPFTASFSTVYNSLDAIDCLGAGIEERNGKPTLRVEPRKYFYQSSETLRLDVVQGLATAPYLPAIHNEVVVGYQHWQSNTVVGLDEFNGLRTYALPVVSQKATYSAISNLNAGGYLLETSRRQPYSAGTNAEGGADQELFIVQLRRAAGGGLLTEKGEAFSSVSGILDKDTAYNERLSPVRNRRRHDAFIRAGLVPQAAAGKKLLLTKTEGNDSLVTQLLTEVAPVEERESPVISDLASPPFVAETYEFTAKLRRNQVRQVVKSPYGLISFLDRQGTRRRGYLLKLECTPSTGKASFTLLRAAS